MLTDAINPADYQRLLASLSHKAYRRAAAKGFHVEFDDLMQEANKTLCYIIEEEKFDPKHGVKFSTYLWQSVRNNLKRIEGKVIDVQVKTSSLDAVIGDDVGTMHDIIPDDCETMDEKLLRLEAENETFGTMSQAVKNVIAVLDSPSSEVHKELRRQEAFRDHCKANKMAAAARVLDVHSVCTILGYDTTTIRQVKRELKELTTQKVVKSDPPMLSEPCYVCGASFACPKCEGALQIGDILYG